MKLRLFFCLLWTVPYLKQKKYYGDDDFFEQRNPMSSLQVPTGRPDAWAILLLLGENSNCVDTTLKKKSLSQFLSPNGSYRRILSSYVLLGVEHKKHLYLPIPDTYYKLCWRYKPRADTTSYVLPRTTTSSIFP